jgi:regulator of replication initiation timing
MDATLTQLIQELVDLSAKLQSYDVELHGLRQENIGLRQQLTDLQAAYDVLRGPVDG